MTRILTWFFLACRIGAGLHMQLWWGLAVYMIDAFTDICQTTTVADGAVLLSGQPCLVGPHTVTFQSPDLPLFLFGLAGAV
jgi:hypothetical protein